MTDVLKMSRKALTIGIVLTTVLWSMMATVLVAPLKASAAGCTSGTLIKGSLAAVYYCGADMKRYVFPNEKTFKTWYADFSSVITISDADLANLQIGGNATYRPGVRMVKITTDPKTYAVAMGGSLRHVGSEALAVSLYGSAWNTMIDDVADAFFTNYSVGSAIAAAGDYDKNAQMSGSQSINQDKGLASGSVSGSLAAAKASDSPAGATVPQGAMGASFLKFNLSNGGASAMTIDTVTLHRQGPGAVADLSAVYLYEGASRLTTGRSVNSSTNEVNFTGLGLALAAGQTRTLWVAVDVSTTAVAGNVHALGLKDAKSGTTSMSGTPFYGSNFTIGGVDVGGITIAKTGTVTNPKVGETNVKIAEFTLAASSVEDLRLQRLTIFQNGNLAGANLTNLKLKQAGGTLSTATGFDSKLRATFEIAGGFLIEKGQIKTWQVYADIGGTARSGDTIRIATEEASDVYALGQTFGYGATVTRTAYDNSTNDGVDASWSTIEAGQLTLNFMGPSSMDIAENGNDIEVYKFSMTAQSNIEVRNLRLQIDSSDLIDTTAVYTDIKVVNIASGATWWGPKDVTEDDGSEDLVFNDVQSLTAGQTYTFSVRLDVENSAVDGDTVTLSTDAFGGSDLRNLDNSTFLTVASDVVPAGALSGNQMTVRVPSLALSLASTPVNQSYVKGSMNVPVLGINLKAGDGSDSTVTAVTLTGFIDDDGGRNNFKQGSNNDGDSGTVARKVSDELTSCWLKDGSTAVGTAKSPTTSSSEGSGGLLQFTGFSYVVAKGQTKTLTLYCDVSNSAYTDSDNESVDFTVAAATDVTAQDPDGNSITPTNTVNAAHTTSIEVTNTGTMTYALASDDSESEASIVIAGQSNVVLGKVRLTAANEELKQTKLRVQLFTLANYTNLSTMSLYDGSTLVAGPVPVGSNGFADFSGFAFVVPKDSSKTLTVKGNLNTIANGAVSGKDLKIQLDLLDAASGVQEYRGTSSSTVVTSNGTLDFATADLDGRSKVIRKTKPTIANVALDAGATLTNGDLVLKRLSITADAAEQVSVKSITWNISMSGVSLAPTTQSSVREFGQGSNITGAADARDADAGCDATETACTVETSFTDEQTIAAGTSKTYELVMTVGAAASNDNVSTNNLADTALVTGELEDAAHANAEIDGVVVDDLDGTDGTEAFNLVWSDNSAIPHTDDVDADVSTDDANFSNDWTNGYLVKVLPTVTSTLTAP